MDNDKEDRRSATDDGDEDTVETKKLVLPAGAATADDATEAGPLPPPQGQAFMWIAHLESELDQLRMQWSQLDEELGERETRIASLDGELETARARIEELETELKVRDETSEHKDSELSTLRAELASVTEQRDDFSRLSTKLAADLERQRVAMSELDQSLKRITVLGTNLQRVDRGRRRGQRAPTGDAGTEIGDNVLYLGAKSRSQPTRTRMLVSLEGGESLRFPLQKQNTTIGRSHESDIRINGQFISRVHARVLTQGPGTVIEDLGSKNGVFVNSQPVTRCTLKDGDIVNLGGKLDLRYVELEI